jgi:thiol-disulfide isomerase/thioredoxin
MTHSLAFIAVRSFVGRGNAHPAFLFATVVLLAGCATKPPPVGEVTLHQIDAPGLAQVLEKHRGQVVLVDFWATWCGPCVSLFPHAVELHRRYADRGLAVVTVSLDDPDNDAAVRKFLVGQKATMENFLSSYGISPAAFDALGIADGSLPHVRLYDRQGKLQRTFASGGKSVDPEEVELAAERLLKPAERGED